MSLEFSVLAQKALRAWDGNDTTKNLRKAVHTSVDLRRGLRPPKTEDILNTIEKQAKLRYLGRP